jgi:hypothetical protein
VARGAADGLDERALGAEEAFLVGVEYGDEGDLGEVEPSRRRLMPRTSYSPLRSVAEELDALKGSISECM